MQTELTGPDLAAGVADLPDGGMIAGHAGGEPVVLVRRGGEIFAIGATCTHYGGPLGEGLVVGNTIHCPWHHACFDLRSGEALRAPALNPVAVWNVEKRGDRIVVTGKRGAPPSAARAGAPTQSIGIVGAGLATFAIFAPSIVMTMLFTELLTRFRRPRLLEPVLAAVSVWAESWLATPAAAVG